MILGFAHLAICTADPDSETARLEQRGWSAGDVHQSVPNPRPKLPLMSRPATSHALHLLKGTPAVELVCYDTGAVDAQTRLRMGEGCIQVLARDARSEAGFLCDGLGFKHAGDTRVTLASQLPGWRVDLVIDQRSDAPLDPPLDAKGAVCLAFYSSAPAADSERLVAAGGRDATGTFELRLGGRTLEVGMLRSPEGTIIELIKPKGGP